MTYSVEPLTAMLQVARAFSVYFSQLVGLTNVFQVNMSGRPPLDYLAFCLVIVMTAFCIYSTKVASHGNIGAVQGFAASRLKPLSPRWLRLLRDPEASMRCAQCGHWRAVGGRPRDVGWGL